MNSWNLFQLSDGINSSIGPPLAARPNTESTGWADRCPRSTLRRVRGGSVAWCSVAWYGTHGAPPDAGWASIDWVGALVATSVSRVQEERVAESAGAITRGHRDRRLKGRPASGRDLDSPKRWSWWLAWTTTSEKSSPSSATCSRRASSCSTGYGICHSTGTSSGRATSGAPLTSTRSCGSFNSSTGEWDKEKKKREKDRGERREGKKGNKKKGIACIIVSSIYRRVTRWVIVGQGWPLAWPKPSITRAPSSTPRGPLKRSATPSG